MGFDMLTPIYLIALPRSGSNLLLALLHNHPQVWALSHDVTRTWMEGGWSATIRAEDLPSLKSIYPRARFRKDPEQVKYVVFDKVPPRARPPGGIRLALSRMPEGILASRKRFAERWGYKLWQLTRANVQEFVRDEWRPWREAPEDAIIRFDALVRWPIHSLDALFGQLACTWMGWEGEPDTAIWFRNGESECCGAEFEVGKSTAYASAVLERLNAEVPPRPHFVCSKCGEPAIGYGLFNPWNPIHPGKAEEWREILTAEEKRMIDEVVGDE